MPDYHGTRPEWGVIITADCDIAQYKMGDYFTYLVILPAQDYLEHIWAAEEIGKIATRAGSAAVEQIHRMDKRRDPNAMPLEPAELLEWLRADGADAILDAVSITQASVRTKTRDTMETFALTDPHLTGFSTPLDRLKACWARSGRKEAEQRGLLQSALTPRQMRSDCVLTPTLPSESEVGFVVMLRDIRAIQSTALYPSRLDLRIRDGGWTSMYRVG